MRRRIAAICKGCLITGHKSFVLLSLSQIFVYVLNYIDNCARETTPGDELFWYFKIHIRAWQK